ncbi:hypothetical protein B0T26DRAFT_703386 [Lasiosphaeria miniovina]|uniref:Uncharacterized protein n=1 Tax=Lasiosphaeria miniovina TaxID=1954250 RepID=A0AA40AV54_9PEZI|nr:uncharacterized protein B0T26DRAFT_703386 [Lasiosphaeria miniovina]KAK0722605.1 hypothetical protein B0T26DRAFT_703386 [Lasiosphaeria miniovina]
MPLIIRTCSSCTADISRQLDRLKVYGQTDRTGITTFEIPTTGDPSTWGPRSLATLCLGALRFKSHHVVQSGNTVMCSGC